MKRTIAILFDLDGTLIDTETLHAKAEAQLLTEYGVSIAPDEISRKYAGVPTEHYIEDLAGTSGKLDELIAKKDRLMENLASETGIRPVRGMPDLVHHLTELGIPIFIVSSSSPEWIEKCLDTKFQLDGKEGCYREYFKENFISGAEVKHPKPAADVFLEARRRLEDLHPELKDHGAEWLVIGDGIADAQGALRANMRPLIIGPFVPEQKGVAIFPSAQKLAEHIEGLRQGDPWRSTEIVSISSPNIFFIKERIDIARFLETFDGPGTLFLITSAVQKISPFSPRQGNMVQEHTVSKNVLDASISTYAGTSLVVAIGASKVIDQAKYIAARLNVPLIVAPSLLTTNAFSTDRSVLRIDDHVASVASKMPNKAYIIPSLLETAPRGYNRFGLIDVLSIHTALADWDIAIRARRDGLALEYRLARSMLETYLSTELAQESYYDITKLLWCSGLVVGMYGDGRPESGSEHIIAKAIESKSECFHAQSVSFGILTAMRLQGSTDDRIVERTTEIPQWSSNQGQKVLDEIEKRISSKDIRPRSGRYTVLNERTETDIERALQETISYLRNDIRL